MMTRCKGKHDTLLLKYGHTLPRSSFKLVLRALAWLPWASTISGSLLTNTKPCSASKGHVICVGRIISCGVVLYQYISIWRYLDEGRAGRQRHDKRVSPAVQRDAPART